MQEDCRQCSNPKRRKQHGYAVCGNCANLVKLKNKALTEKQGSGIKNKACRKALFFYVANLVVNEVQIACFRKALFLNEINEKRWFLKQSLGFLNRTLFLF